MKKYWFLLSATQVFIRMSVSRKVESGITSNNRKQVHVMGFILRINEIEIRN